MPRKLCLHVGTHRTATTSIQNFLRRNFQPLMAKGIFNPFGAGRHFGLMNRLFDGTVTPEEAAADLTQRADAKEHEIHTIVLSDEDIVMRRDLTPLARLAERFDTRVIFAMRRQDLWLESWHQQNVKWQWNPRLAHLTFPEFLDKRAEFHWIHYDAMVARLETVFGPGAVDLIVFERDQMPGGPVETFTRLIGLESHEGLAPAWHTNPSHSPLMSEFMRTLPLDQLTDPQRQLVEAACMKVDRAIPDHPGGHRLMDGATRTRILGEYAAGNRAVARRRFGRDELFLDPLPPRDAPVAPQRLPGDSYETITTFVAPVLKALIEANFDDKGLPRPRT